MRPNPLAFILDLILPRRCEHCGRGLKGEIPSFFCSPCWKSIRLWREGSCLRCGRPFGSPEAVSHSPGRWCGPCRKKPPVFERAVSAGPYEGVLAEALHLFKYGGKTRLVKPLGALFLQPSAGFPRPDAMVPVPLHPARLREREFNQALLLCDEMSRQNGISVIPDGLKRIRHTPPQVGLNPKERASNVRGAFSVIDPGLFKKKRIMLVDDVLTTGATVRECARTLKRAGAREVYVLTLARASGLTGSV